MKANMTVEEWEQQANRETRGDMVWDILRDYKAAEAEVARLRGVLADIAAADADASFTMSALAFAALDNSGQDAAGG